MGPWIVRKRWWTPPWGPHGGVTLYPFVFLRPRWSEELLRHELIHVRQVRRNGWLRFYARYLWRSLRTPYRNLPSEIEAYACQADPNYLPASLEALVRSDDA